MRQYKLLIIAFCALVFLFGCARSVTTQTEVVDTRPVVSFVLNADSKGAQLYIDGLHQGEIDTYSYPNSAIRLLPGRHLVEVKKNGLVIYKETRVFSEGIDYKINVTP
ncbi:hypothetical protein CWE15_10825 [Aliidiomarina taiwanensis]|uniref:PEGA domain-containing protein n=1 Tax=Aliidiomarina taiwanensis TaxID=946228 RepID=A0A432WW62_9GAMM|nr:hypothetical protein [Aliidiomarina taiwanensis]RUO38003.1 hypothetical protein CWE15_10825 [Aliidiomarina taiwanensis]